MVPGKAVMTVQLHDQVDPRLITGSSLEAREPPGRPSLHGADGRGRRPTRRSAFRSAKAFPLECCKNSVIGLSLHPVVVVVEKAARDAEVEHHDDTAIL